MNFRFLRAKTIAVAIVLVTAINCVSIVPTGYTGVRTTFGQISSETVPNGLNLKLPYIQKMNLINNKQQDKDFASNQVWGETKDQVQVYAQNAVVSYRLNPEKSAYLYTNFSGIDNIINEVMFDSAFKQAASTLGPSEATKRDKIEPATQEKLQQLVDEKYGADTVTISLVVINQMDFSNDYNQVIADKNAAQQKQEQQAIENQTNVAKAAADAEVARTTAQGKADAAKIEAEGKAEANKILSNSVTENTLKQDMLSKWNGELPKVVSDTSNVFSSVDAIDSDFEQ